jgi:hypothetical protein
MAMKKTFRVLLPAGMLAVLAGAVALHAAAAQPGDGNRLEATFAETNTSITNRIADLGVFQLINTGSGTFEGYGAATMVLGVTQDRLVHPCGAGSWTNAGVRRITVAAGVLVIRELAYVCPTPSGLVGTSTWTVDGPSSTGVFAGARGEGTETIDLTAHTSTLTGKLLLAD